MMVINEACLKLLVL